MKDISLFENSNGGDLFVFQNDLQRSSILAQQIYLSLFGGNVEASTKGNEIDSELRYDWWANSLLFNEQEKQFNSETERILNSTPLNSSGRIAIQRAVENDLRYLNDIINYTVIVQINSSNRAEVYIRYSEINNKSEKKLQFLWDSVKNEIIFKQVI